MADIFVDNATLMDRYYNQRALSAIAPEPFFKITDVVWGGGFISYDENKRPVVDEIPSNVTTITGEFYRNTPTLSYVNGATTLRATITVSELDKDVNAQFSALYILDDKSEIIAVLAIAPIWMNSKRSLTVEAIIDIGQ